MSTARFNSRAKKSLGQNFLVDDIALDRIAALVPEGIPLLLEIGPGQGALTRKLAGRAAKLCLLEKDEALLANTRARLLREGTETAAIWEADALDFDYRKVWTDSGANADTELVVAANLPYNVATEILFRLIDLRARIPYMVLMFQKEVAERIAAKHGGRTFGIISIFIQNFYECEVAMTLRPGSFRPRPKVDSSVVVFRRRERPLLDISGDDWDEFRDFVRNLFRYRRKTLENSLKMPGLGYGRDVTMAALYKAGIDGIRRAETLSIPEFGKLFEALSG